MNPSWKRDAILFLTSQALSLLGSALVQYALMWHVTLETRSGVLMTLFIVAGFVPTFLLSPFAGVWADRYDRRRLIIASDLLIAFITVVLAVVLSLHGKALWLFFVAAAVRSIGTAVQQPAVGALVPQLVPQEHLMRFNSIQGTIFSANALVAPALAGFLMSVAPLQVLFLVDAVTAVIAVALLAFFIKVAPRARSAAATQPSYYADMREGFRYIRRHPHLVPFFGYLSVVLILITPAAFLTPLQTARTFGTEVWRLTAIEMVFSVGMMIGGALLAAWGGFPNRMRTMVVSTLAMGACTVALGVLPHFALYLGAMGLFGVALPLYNTPATVLVQERVEADFLGRVLSIISMLSTSLMPLAMLLFGPLAEVVSIERLLQVTGVGVLVLGALAPLHRRLMDFGAPVPVASPAPASSATPVES